MYLSSGSGLAPALVLALLIELFLSGMVGATPAPGNRWGQDGPVPPAFRTSSVLLDASGQLRLVDGRHPDAVAWANFTNAIRETGSCLHGGPFTTSEAVVQRSGPSLCLGRD
ncbi:PREDICTED: putative phospholipase B-like 2 [Galeopterus variegatus]|uniref:Phospholipase B-like 2 n=1 Tax=Galeopterus variegatus TaxID=482537 RepID=A0ABM0Q636_GALVR|nr:PREDICTED: putative phospholipase B-like 2 [Galeopterus variegatus]